MADKSADDPETSGGGWRIMVKCFDCENFENRCYTNGSVISVCNKRHEVETRKTFGTMEKESRLV